jgi:hypothetical protein
VNKQLLLSAGAAGASFLIFLVAPINPHGIGLLLHSVGTFAWDLGMLGFAVLAVVGVGPVVFRGSLSQRFLSLVVCAWPALVLWSYFRWWLFVSRSGG